jgi:hypothetical protein
MGTCTIIAMTAADSPNYVACFVPLKEAIAEADMLKLDGSYLSIRVYAESREGNLTLIYTP